ncbi:hypothetical protein SAMN06265219_10288 [Gracilimonas mengyeensis]|uniref:Uncharacterized protein n=1 Tax=Gracilimonas mengyeensis TaxID=1302730 RepID=A0A521B8E1_9BACT|nr:hypothetical protein SAMN06265219_10288 [Gracilimonas mengyeensis]
MNVFVASVYTTQYGQTKSKTRGPKNPIILSQKNVLPFGRKTRIFGSFEI